MNGILGIGGVLGLLLVVGGAIGAADRKHFSLRWLLVAAGLVLLNDVLLTHCYGRFPDLLPGARWNWQGKGAALAATLVVASLPAFGWRRCGLTGHQTTGSLRSTLPVALAYCLFFAAIALPFPDRAPISSETIAFQLTMPGLEEEAFYRGILLFALDRAFAARVQLLGVEWSWGAVMSCALFGLAHAFGVSRGGFSFDPMTMTLTAIPSLIAIWIRVRTGSVLLPIVLHNFGNSIPLFI